MVQKTIIIIEQGYINIGCDDDDDDGGCGESFFFYAFVFEGKQNKKSNTGYFLHGQCSIHSSNSFVGGFLRVLSSD